MPDDKVVGRDSGQVVCQHAQPKAEWACLAVRHGWTAGLGRPGPGVS